MARSFSNTKPISAFLADIISNALKSGGHAVGAATEGAVAGRSKIMFRKGGGEGSKVANSNTSSASTTPWMPDPKTGYYRPDDGANEMDAVELRRLLLNHKLRRN